MEGTHVSQTEVEQLQARIERLERQNRRTRLVAGFVSLLAGATFWMAQVPLPSPPPAPLPPPPPSARAVQPKSLEATELRLVDESGHDRIVLSGKGLPMILVLDDWGRTKMRIGLTLRGPTIGFFDEHGRYVDLVSPHGFRPIPLTQ